EGTLEPSGGTAQHPAGVRSHHGTDPDMALRYHSHSTRRSLSQDARALTSTILGNPYQPSHPECAEDFVRPFLCGGLRQPGDGDDHRVGAGALPLSGPTAI